MRDLFKIKRTFEILKESRSTIRLLPEPYRQKYLLYWLDLLYCIPVYGALPEDYISLQFYKLKRKDRKKYITQGNKRLFFKKFYDDEARKTLASKELFNKKFSKYVKRDWIYTKNVQKQAIIDFIKLHKRVIVKPNSSTWGQGIFVTDESGIDNILRDIELGQNFMIEELVENHKDIKKINPNSVNTLRVETCIDAKGNFHLLNVLLMIGTSNAIVSNCHSGGMMCHINITTGMIDNDGYNPIGIWYDTHPVSGIRLRGG